MNTEGRQALQAKINQAFAFAVNHHAKGDLTQAERAYRQIIDAVPDHADSIHNLGLILYQRGSLEEAIAAFRRALAIKPNSVEAYNNLGNALVDQGRIADAETAFREALQLKPDYAEAHYNLGNALDSQGRVDEAESAFREALRVNPDFAEAHNNLGLALDSQGHVQEAETAFREAVRLQPDYAEAYYNLGNALETQDREDEAETAYRQALKLNPDDAPTYSNLGLVLESQGRAQEAEVAYRQALQLQADFPEAYCNLGHALAEQGHMQESEDAYRQALRLKPDFAEAFHSLVLHSKYDSADHEDVARALALLDRPGITDKDAMHFRFSLGKIYDDCGAYEQAFAHFQEANRLRGKTARFNLQRTTDFISRVIYTFGAGFFSQSRTQGSTSEAPVFIIGMPRAGKSLVERIIAAHPQVHGAGELKKMPQTVDQLSSRVPGLQAYPECVQNLDGDTAELLANEYEARLLRDASDNILRVADTLPINYFHLGLIAVLFPKARVIHCIRDPLDNCLSMYFKYFAKGGFDYTYELTDLGTYYAQYQLLMTHWREVLPIKMYEIQYEELVTDEGGKAKELIDLLDLDWDERCLLLPDDERSGQVRQPLHNQEVDRWRNYETYLEPVKKSLGFD